MSDEKIEVKPKVKCYVWDIDGVIAHNNKGRDDFYTEEEWLTWFRAQCPFFKPIPESCGLLAFCARNTHICLLTGRSNDLIHQTIQWLSTWITYVKSMDLYMREKTDNRSTAEFKADIMQNKILPKQEVLFAVDDDLTVIQEYHKLGVNCLHLSE